MVLCKGLESQHGRISAVHQNETYDVDLEPNKSIPKSQREVGLQIPPEYLRKTNHSREGNTVEKNHHEALKATVSELYRQRQSLREELESLTHEKEALEAKIPLQNDREQLRDVADIRKGTKKSRSVPPISGLDVPQNSPGAAQTQNRDENPLCASRGQSVVSPADTAPQPNLHESDKNAIPVTRCWLGSLSCGGQPFAKEIAFTVLPLLPGSETVLNGEIGANLDCYDIIAVALQDCPTSGDAAIEIIRTALSLDDKFLDGDWCTVSTDSQTSSMFSGAMATTLAIFVRREVISDDSSGLQKTAAPLNSGLTTVAAFVTLKDDTKLAFLSANTTTTVEGESIQDHNARVVAHFAADALNHAKDDWNKHSSIDISRECDHAFFIGDLGYSYEFCEDTAKRCDVINLIAANDWANLSSADVLRQQKAEHRVFSGANSY